MSGPAIDSERARPIVRLLACCMLAGLLGSWASITRADTTLSADIPPQPVAEALAEFAHQTRLQFIYVSKIVKARVSQGAHAGQTATEALPLLLDGTGLDFAFLNSRTVRIFESAAGAPAEQANAAAASKTRFNRSEPLTIGPDEVVVTGSRSADDRGITEDVQSVAASVSMVGGATLEAQKLEQLSDYAAYLPGLNLDTGGSPSYNLVLLRGIYPLTSASAVAFYIDDSPVVGRPGQFWATPDLIPYDLQQLEVLRGPQGTLGGASDEAGVIRYVLNEPSFSGFEARAGANVSTTRHASQPGSSFQGMVNVPIIDDVLAVRASGYDTYTPGFIDNVYSGAQDVNVIRRYGGRITALWRPTESLSLKVSALWNLINTESNDLVVSTGSATVVVDGDANIYSVKKSWGAFKQDTAFLPTYQTNLNLYAATLHWNPGSAEIVSATSWSRNGIHQDHDTGTGSSFPDLSGGTIPAGLSKIQYDTDLEKFSEDLRISSPPGRRIEWLLGGYYTRESLTDQSAEYAFDTSYRPIAVWAPFLSFQRIPNTFSQRAVFGDLTWRVTDHINVTGGIRNDHNDFSFYETHGGATQAPGTSSGQYSEGVTTWAATAQYHFTPEVMLYGRVATGYLPGTTNGTDAAGLVARPPVKADGLTNYEMGLKSEFLDRRGMVDLTVFYIDWKDIQLTFQDPSGWYLINGGRALSRGVELASAYSPLHTLRFGYNAAYTQSEYTELAPNGGNMLTGYQLPQVPKWSMSFTADYDWALTGLWHAHVGGAWRWIGPLWTELVASRSLGGAPTMELPAYSILDLNTSLATGPLVLRVFARNLTDTRASRRGHLWFDPSGTVAYTEDYMVQPRTIGIGIDYTF